MPVSVHVIDHPDARVPVDTGMTELHPAVADLDPRLHPLSKQEFDLAGPLHAMLMSREGPFATSRDRTSDGDPLPYAAPPAGLFADVRTLAG